MNKAQEFRAEIEKAEQLKKEQQAAQKIKEEQERAAKKASDLPLDIELAAWLVANHQQNVLKGKERECKITLGGDNKRSIDFDDRSRAPQTIANHYLNNDNLDEVAEAFHADGFVVAKKWIPEWHSHDIDYPADGGNCYYLEVTW